MADMKKRARKIIKRKVKWSNRDQTELEKLSAALNQLDKKDMMARAFGEKIALELKKKWPRNTSVWSECLASICIKLDRDVGCRKLLIEWFHEKYGGHIVEKHIDQIHEARDMLKGLKYTEADCLEEGDGDYQSWSENEHVFIMQDQHVRYAVITKSEPWYELHVRKLWYRDSTESRRRYFGYPTIRSMRKKHWEPEYGDCRDCGYVLSYGGFTKFDKTVDRAASFWSDIEHFIWRLGSALTVLHESQTERLSEIREKG